jgi:hypothetical protein
MIIAYGTQSGFGWKPNEIVAAQIVSVPMAVALGYSAKIRNLFIGVLAGVFLLLIGLVNLLPILMITVSRADGRSGEVLRPHAALAAPIKAFGYGLLAAGIAVVMVAYVVIYARGGFAELAEALNPFVLVNYASLAAVVPGVLTIWLASYLRANVRGGAISQSHRYRLQIASDERQT